MKYFLPLSSVQMLLVLVAGCAVSSMPIILYDQSKLPKDQVVTLLPASAQNIYMVLKVDEQIAGGSCFANCMFIKPVHISPGRHEFTAWNMKVPGYTELNATVVFNFKAELESGKTYQLQVNPLLKAKDQEQKFEISWQQVVLPR